MALDSTSADHNSILDFQSTLNGEFNGRMILITPVHFILRRYVIDCLGSFGISNGILDVEMIDPDTDNEVSLLVNDGFVPPTITNQRRNSDVNMIGTKDSCQSFLIQLIRFFL